MRQRAAFTLIEVLIAIMLVGLMLPAMFRAIDVLSDSNKQIYRHINQNEQAMLAWQTLYLDIAGSDGNLSVKKDDFDRLCIFKTVHTLYGEPFADVCWVVTKDEPHRLIRTEGNDYTLPLNEEDAVYAETAISSIEHFHVYYKKNRVLVVFRLKGQKPSAFTVYGVSPSKSKKRSHKERKVRRNGEDESR